MAEIDHDYNKTRSGPNLAGYFDNFDDNLLYSKIWKKFIGKEKRVSVVDASFLRVLFGSPRVRKLEARGGIL